MHEFSLTADALLASFAKPRCCGAEIYRCSKGRLADSARQLRLDACRTGSARRLLRRQWYRGRRGVTTRSWPCAGRFGCMGASPLRLSFYQPYPHRPPNRAGPKRKRIPLVERCIGPAATRGSRVTSRISAHESRPAQSAERDPVLSQNPADNRIDLACPIQSETAPNNFGDHLSTHFLLTPSTPKCSAESCRCHRRTSAI
jgi:hypothetical protein